MIRVWRINCSVAKSDQFFAEIEALGQPFECHFRKCKYFLIYEYDRRLRGSSKSVKAEGVSCAKIISGLKVFHSLQCVQNMVV